MCRRLPAIAALAMVTLDCGSQPYATAPTPTPSGPQWAVSGSVRDVAGIPIKGATVALTTILGVPSAFTARTTTDVNGHYSFAPVDQGNYSLEAGAPGYATLIDSIMRTSTLTKDLTLPLDPDR